MPTINIDRKNFEKLVGKKLPTDKLKDRISYLGTDLEEVSNDNITVEIFPNRPDMLSVQGFARSFSSFIGHKTGLKNYKTNRSKEKVIIEKSVSKVRPYTACAIVKGIEYDNKNIKDVIDIQEKLHITYGRNRKKVAIGIYPFEKIKTPIRFMAKKPEEIKFRPLEANKEMDGIQILAQHPTGRDYGHLLDNCAEYPIFIDANDEILSMPPIINSHNIGKINQETRDVFIECSGFDFRVLNKCLNMVVTAFADIGGKVYSMELHYPDKIRVTPDLSPEEIKLDIKYINKLLGLNLNEAEIKKCLEKMGYGYKNNKALIPAYRADILHQSDLAEDIAIAYGYENFEPQIPRVATIAEENRYEIFKNKVADILVGLELLETFTYNLTNREFQNENMLTELRLIELSNSVSQGYDVLRAWVVPSLIEVLKNNKHHDYPQKIFTIGRIFKKNDKEETGIEENERLGVVIADEDTDYTDIKQVLDYLFRMLNVRYDIEETDHASFIEGRAARIKVNGKGVAYIGELAPDVISNWELDVPLTALELNLTELFELMNKA